MLSRAICLFINLFVCVSSYSQDTLHPVKLKQLPISETFNKFLLLPSPLSSNYTGKSRGIMSISPLPAGYYFNSVGFFCQKELQIENAVRIPVRVRLGSASYTDKMEGKGQLYLPPVRKNQ